MRCRPDWLTPYQVRLAAGMLVGRRPDRGRTRLLVAALRSTDRSERESRSANGAALSSRATSRFATRVSPLRNKNRRHHQHHDTHAGAPRFAQHRNRRGRQRRATGGRYGIIPRQRWARPCFGIELLDTWNERSSAANLQRHQDGRQAIPADSARRPAVDDRPTLRVEAVREEPCQAMLTPPAEPRLPRPHRPGLPARCLPRAT